jgi:hypothetical protein
VARELNVAVLFQANDRLAEAEPLRPRAQAATRRVLVLGNPETAGLMNLAALYHGANRSANAEPHMRRAVMIRV